MCHHNRSLILAFVVAGLQVFAISCASTVPVAPVAPSILTQPSSQTVTAGQPVTFTASTLLSSSAVSSVQCVVE